MFFAGHMAVGALIARITIRGKIAYSLPLVFAASLVPDLDLAFLNILQHHQVTHSIPFGVLLYAPVFYFFRLKTLPYFIATLSHYMVADLVTGNPPLLFGLTNQRFGLFYQLFPDVVQQSNFPIILAAIEFVAVAIYIVVSCIKKDVSPLFSSSYDIKHVLVLGCVMFAIFFGSLAGNIGSELAAGLVTKEPKLVAYQILAIAHAIFIIVLLTGTRKSSIRPLRQALAHGNLWRGRARQ